MFFTPGVSIVLVDTYWAGNSEEIDDLYGQYTSEGYEGQMIRQDTAYHPKRTKDLLKRKEFITEEYKVVEVHEGQGNWAGYAQDLLCRCKMVQLLVQELEVHRHN